MQFLLWKEFVLGHI